MSAHNLPADKHIDHAEALLAEVEASVDQMRRFSANPADDLALLLRLAQTHIMIAGVKRS